MGLLSSGDREGSWPARCLFAALVIWLVVQAAANVHRYTALDGNIRSLGDELNLSNEQEFRRQLVHVLELNDVPISPGEIEVAVDAARDAYVVTVPCRWTVDLHWWHLDHTSTLTAHIPRRRIGS